jgi:UDP-N-acetylglucosamine 2-epimerase (non-hydrolysing)
VTAHVMVLVGTRPEVIKLAPVARALKARSDAFRCTVVSSGQHADLVDPLARELGLAIDRRLEAGRPGQEPLALHARILDALAPLLLEERPDALLVQGDTGTALAGALAGFHQRVPVGHVEAGLRSGNLASPFPEEMNRRLISTLAKFHFAATPRNARQLREEGIDSSRIEVTGNPVVDSVRWAIEHTEPSERVRALRGRVGERRLLMLTTHRRESFGCAMGERLAALRTFCERHPDVALVFPVHPNPRVRGAAERELGDTLGAVCIEPLEYLDFVHLLSHAWLIVSDSGGIQEEAPSLGRAVLVIRENTERPEAIEAGVARLVPGGGDELLAALEACHADPSWLKSVAAIENPFGRGDAGPRIAQGLACFLAEGL